MEGCTIWLGHLVPRARFLFSVLLLFLFYSEEETLELGTGHCPSSIWANKHIWTAPSILSPITDMLGATVSGCRGAQREKREDGNTQRLDYLGA